MQITIPAKLIKRAIEYKVDYHITSEYTDDVLKAAGITKSTLVTALMADTAFLNKLEKEIISIIDNDDNLLWDAVVDVRSAVISTAQSVCNKAQETIYKKQDAAMRQKWKEQEQERIQITIKMLEQHGYKVTKA